MEMVRVDTQRAYELLWEEITTLKMAPGAPINEYELSERFEMGVVPVREALRLLAHDGLVEITPRHGVYVAEINLSDLEQLSEARLSLEALSARLAAQRADEDDLVILRSLRQEQAAIQAEDRHCLFDLDHKFHQAIAHASRNRYLAQTLERLFGLSRRMWYLVLPHLEYLPAAVGEHLELIEAIETGAAERAEALMREHVGAFYDKVHETLRAQEGDEES